MARRWRGWQPGGAMAGTTPEPPLPGGDPLRDLKLTCMSNLLAASDERVYFKDLLSRFLFVSAGFIDAYAPGLTAEEIVGKTDFDLFSDHHASAAFKDEQQIIGTGEPVVGKLERETYEGKPDAWVSTTKMPLRDARGRIIGTFGITRDVTAQIRAENALAHQALQLRTQNEGLRELDRLKDEFIGLVTHELRTPLTSIMGYVELLRDDNGVGPDAGHFAEVIERNALRLLRLVGDLLFLSRMQSGKLTMEFRDADLADIAASAVEELRPEARRKHIHLSLTATSVPVLALDPTRMAQLLGNLISNAVKFTPAGGKVDVRVGMEENKAVLTVTDSGIGIPAADREVIFERFFRTAEATQQAIPGTGLGLTITKAIVEAHHGTISVDSDEGRGSTFTVHLPIRHRPASHAQGAPARRQASGGAVRPWAGGEAARPRAGGEAARPRAGGEPGGEAARPRAGGEAARPRAGGEAARPRAGGEAARPRAAGEAGGEAARPRAGGEAARPRAAGEAGGEAARPRAGGSSARPGAAAGPARHGDGHRADADPRLILGAVDDLGAEDKKIITLARSARARAATEEGAAVRDETGRTYTAASVALPSLRLSAMQLAVATAVSSGANSLEAAALVSDAEAPSAGDLKAVRDLGPAATVFHAGTDGTLRATLLP
jgi:PAS domain S-box-containing protein